MEIEDLTDAEREWIQVQLAAASLFVSETLGGQPPSHPDPASLDEAFAKWLNSEAPHHEDANDVVNSVGVAFGTLLVDRISELNWVIATDDYGTELAVFGLQGAGDIVVYPQNFVAKRYEAQKSNFIAQSVLEIQAQVESVKSEWKQKKPWWKAW